MMYILAILIAFLYNCAPAFSQMEHHQHMSSQKMPAKSKMPHHQHMAAQKMPAKSKMPHQQHMAAQKMPAKSKMPHHQHMMMGPKFSWSDPSIKLSPPPPLMGQQMGQIHSINVPPLGYKMDGNVKVFTLIAQPIEVVFTKGKPRDLDIIKPFHVPGWKMQHGFEKKVKLWGYNGHSPGPVIECIVGDRVRIIVKNELPEPTSIHWHGLEVPNDMDGAGGHTQRPILPGETFVYEFTLHQVGTFMYHTGFNMMKQDGMGLGGLFIIHPKEYEKPIDRDIAIMLHAFAVHPDNDFPDLVTMEFDWFTFNGKVAPDIETITVNEGERVRLRFGNLSMDSHPIHVHGFTWKVVGTEGGPIPESAQWPGNTINVPPGTTRDVEFIANNPGLWRMHCHKLHHIMNPHTDVPLGVMDHGGMFTFVHVLPKQKGADQ